MPDATITSTASTFGTITGTFAADQSTVTGTVSSLITGTLSGSVGVPGPQGPAGPQGPEGPPGPPGPGSTWGTITGTLSAQTDLQTALNLKANLASPVFTGDPQAPTATFGDNDTTIATTAFVQAGLLGGTANARNLEVYVRNQSGSTIPAGAIVYISGATGNRPLITLAQANNDANSAQTIGFVKTSIANNGFGYVIVRGELENIDTSALTEGVQLYLSPTTAGTWTTTKPSAPEHLVYVGIVIRSHPTLGVILVAVQNGYELNELHDVAISSPTNGQVLKYDSATNLWKNSTDSAGVAWGGITGTLSNQTDLQSALDAKQSVSGMTAYLTKAGNLSGLTNLATARDNLQLGTSNDVYFSSVISNTGTVTSILGGATNGLEIFDGVTNGIKIDKDGITFPDLTVQTTAFTTAQLGAYLAKASNLSDLASASTARTNLGLGSLAVVNDAPSDGNQYARKNGAWDIVSSTSPYITSVSSPLSVTGGNLTIDLSAYLTSATAASTYQTIAGMSSYLTTSAAASTYYLQTNPAGYITSSALSPYLTSATAASTYQTLSGMSSYLTTATAASTYATILEPSVDGILTVEPSGSNSATVQVNQDANNYIHLRPGVGQIAMVYGGSTKWFFNDTYLQFPGGTQQTVAYPGPSGFLLKADNLSGLANTATARTNLGLGTMATETASNYLTTATAASTYAPLASPALTGNPTAPTPATADNDTSIATTAFVKAQGYLTSAPVTSVAGKTGAVTLVVGDVSGAAPLASPTFTGTPAAPTASAGTSTTQLATTAFVTTADNLKANLASPTFTGTPSAPTATAGTNTTQIATTAFVTAAVPASATHIQSLQFSSTSAYTRVIDASSQLLAPSVLKVWPSPSNLNGTSTSGAGASASLSITGYTLTSPSAGVAGSARCFFANVSGDLGAAMWGGASSNTINFGRRVSMAFRFAQFPSSTSSVTRVVLGKIHGTAVGDLTTRGIGVKYVPNGANFDFQLQVHNGTTLTSVTSSTQYAGGVADLEVVSDGAGNAVLYLNGNQVASTTGAPTGVTSANATVFAEVESQATTANQPSANIGRLTVNTLNF